MKRLSLPNSPLSIGQIGFGCAYLTGGYETRASTRLVQTAIDSGYQHFDVAPPYGIGTAEDVLGVALEKSRARVTIATKVGIPRGQLTPRLQLIRWMTAPLRRHIPSITRKYGSRLHSPGSIQRNFSVPSVVRSVSESMQRLRTDYLDLLLLHEVSPEDISEELLLFLDRQRQAGYFRAIGIASSRLHTYEIAKRYAGFFDVFQYSSRALDGALFPLDDSKFKITHSALLGAHRVISQRINCDPVFATKLSKIVKRDLADRSVLADVLLGSALAQNSNGITLVGTRNLDRLRTNIRVADDTELIESGRLLVAALTEETVVTLDV